MKEFFESVVITVAIVVVAEVINAVVGYSIIQVETKDVFKVRK